MSQRHTRQAPAGAAARPRHRHRAPSRFGLRGLWSLVASALAMALTAILVTLPGTASSAAPARTVAAARPAMIRTFAAVGDSITAGMVPGNSLGDPGPTGWVTGGQQGRLVLTGGWAVPGSTTGEMRAHVVPAPADVLVLLGGTNDLARGIPWTQTAGDLQAIAGTVGAREVLLLAIPPNDRNPAARTAFDQQLAGFAALLHWHYLDPWGAVTAPGGSWLPGTTVEGIHPVPAVAQTVGARIRQEVWQISARRTG